MVAAADISTQHRGRGPASGGRTLVSGHYLSVR